VNYDSSTPGASLTLAAPDAFAASDASAGSEAAPDTAPPPSDDSSQPAAPLPGNLNEIMKRMMERRQKSLQ
jgi:hypothetical protein